MQRKNYFLRTSAKKYRAGMAMVMAISVIVILATIMALSLALTTQTAKRTTDIYLYEQSALYAKSAVERALLEIADNGPCTVPTTNYQLGGIYDVNITARYVYVGGGCGGGGDYFTTLVTPDQNGSVLMDIRVSTDAGTEPITYFRRTIQKL